MLSYNILILFSVSHPNGLQNSKKNLDYVHNYKLGLKALAESPYHGLIHAQKMKQITLFFVGRGGGGGCGKITFLKR